MAIFITGATGFIGSYVVAGLLQRHADTRLSLLVRAKSQRDAERRLWKALQLHMGFDEFEAGLRDRCTLLLGDITEPKVGLDDDAWRSLAHTTDSVIHVAASLNRKSSKACYNVNLRGTLSVVKLAQQAHQHHGLRRFTDISTMAVAGVRVHDVVTEDRAIDWNRSDYDSYARTKKFAEHLICELLPDVSKLIFRPTTVLGDSRFPETTQFDMAMAFVWLAALPVLPFDEGWRMDIVPADYVGKAIVELHQRADNAHEAYNLSAGRASPAYRDILQALLDRGYGRPRRFVPSLGRPCETLAGLLMGTPRSWKVAYPASLMKVFFPYLLADTVYDNQRIVEALGEAPVPFTAYAYEYLRFAKEGGFRYPYRPWPSDARDG